MSKKAVVIGSGFGGLSAAVRLLARGYKVTVAERLDQPGGRARVFEQDGFRFDAGPTIITAPFLFEELWALAGERLSDDIELVSLDPFYRIRFHDGEHFDYSGDRDRMREEISRFNPGDLDGFDRFVKLTDELCTTGFEKLGHVPFGSWKDMLRVVPDLARLQAWRSVYGLACRYFSDERLRQVFSFHPLLVGGNPFTTTAIYALINGLERRWGVHYVRGGTGQLVTGLVRLIEKLGGEVRLNSQVESIIIDKGQARGIRLESGETLESDIVISNADVPWTYGNLVQPERHQRWDEKRLARLKPSMSLFVWYFGTRQQYPDVPHHTILLSARYRGLIDDIFKHGQLADDFSLYLHRPTATDSSMAPSGCDAFYVLAPVPNLSNGTQWGDEAEQYRQKIERFLESTMLPGLRDQIMTSRMLTPQNFQDELLAVDGSAFGPQPIMTQSAWFRPHNRSEDVENLFLVGAGTHPGAGVPGVLSSARVLDTVVTDA